MLTTKQNRFITAYKELGDANQACIVAGYSPKSANIEASRLLRNVKIVQELDNWRKERQKEFRKEDFIDYALKDYNSLEVTEPNKPRFLQLAGQAVGIIGNNDFRSPSITNNTQINVNIEQVNALLPSDKWENVRKLLQ